MIPLHKIMDGLRVKVDPTAFNSPAYKERILRIHPNLCTTIYRVRRGRVGEIFLEGLGSFKFESYLLNYAEGIHGFLSRESASGKWKVAESGTGIKVFKLRQLIHRMDWNFPLASLKVVEGK